VRGGAVRAGGFAACLARRLQAAMPGLCR
jgi:hypothetical protein